jgi:hypothetical protein
MADAQLLKLYELQNRVLRAIGNLDRRTPVRELQVAFKILYTCENISRLCRSNPKPCKCKCTCYWTRTNHAREYKRLKPGDGQVCDRSGD